LECLCHRYFELKGKGRSPGTDVKQAERFAAGEMTTHVDSLLFTGFARNHCGKTMAIQILFDRKQWESA
jgi:hypothetical protein